MTVERLTIGGEQDWTAVLPCEAEIDSGQQLAVSPDGGVVVAAGPVLKLDVNGEIRWRHTPVIGGFDWVEAHSAVVDDRGQIAVLGTGAVPCAEGWWWAERCDGYWIQGLKDEGDRVSTVLETWQRYGSESDFHSAHSLSMNHGRLSVVTLGRGDRLVKVYDAPGFAADYRFSVNYSLDRPAPDNPVADLPAVQALQPRYVALGDSVVSGHGLRSQYYEWTCRRSRLSYPHVAAVTLHARRQIGHAYPARHLACSGATTSQVYVQAGDAATKISEWATERPEAPVHALVSLDAGLNDFDFASEETAFHALCDSDTRFDEWVDSTLQSIRLNLVGLRSNGVPRVSDDSILGRVLDSGRTLVVVTGYYDPVAGNVFHPLIHHWQVMINDEISDRSRACDGPAIGRATGRVATVVRRVNETLQEAVADANVVKPALATHGERVRFVQFEQLFAGRVECADSDSYVQRTTSEIFNLDGDDCLHPSERGARVIGGVVAEAFGWLRNDSKYHVSYPAPSLPSPPIG